MTMTTTTTMTIGPNQRWITSAMTTAMGEPTNFGDQLTNGWLQMGRGTQLGPCWEPGSTGQRGTDRWGGSLRHRWGLSSVHLAGRLDFRFRLDFIIFNFSCFRKEYLGKKCDKQTSSCGHSTYKRAGSCWTCNRNFSLSLLKPFFSFWYWTWWRQAKNTLHLMTENQFWVFFCGRSHYSYWSFGSADISLV